MLIINTIYYNFYIIINIDINIINILFDTKQSLNLIELYQNCNIIFHDIITYFIVYNNIQSVCVTAGDMEGTWSSALRFYLTAQNVRTPLTLGN